MKISLQFEAWQATCQTRGVAMVVTASLLLTTLATAAQIPPPLVPLLQQKKEIARNLVEPVAACVQRRDTDFPAFHGCIDWHSAVHGTWALVAYTHATGDRQFERLLLDNILTGENVQMERAYLAKHVGFEMPYGRAWFLRLAVDYERQFSDGRLRASADEVAHSLLQYYESQRPSPDTRDYESDSWALINLIDYARFVDDASLAVSAERLVRENFIQPTRGCLSDKDKGEFLAVCANWAALVARVLPHESYTKWTTQLFGEAPTLKPVARPTNSHEYGLTFSRAWGIWDVYSATGDPMFADAYAALFNAGYSEFLRSSHDYQSVGHWVGQFGMFALQPLFGREKGRWSAQ